MGAVRQLEARRPARREREGEAGDADRGGRGSSSLARPPCRRPPLTEGSGRGRGVAERERCGCRRPGEGPLASGTKRRGGTAARGSSKSGSRDGGRPAVGCRTEGQTARQTDVPGTDWQPGGGSSLPLRSQGPRRRRQRPPSASEQRGAAGTSGSLAEAAAVAAALGAAALPGAPPTPQKAPFISS